MQIEHRDLTETRISHRSFRKEIIIIYREQIYYLKSKFERLLTRTIVIGPVFSMICDRMQMTCRILENWGRTGGLSVNQAMTEMILFTHISKIENFVSPRMYGKPLAQLYRRSRT